MVSKRKHLRKMENTKKDPRKKMILVFFIIGIIIASGIAVYNIDTLYLSKKNSVVASLPDKLFSNSQNSFLISTIDENGKPISDKEVIVTLEIDNETHELFRGETDNDGFVQPIIQIPKVNGTAKIIVKAGSETFSQNVKIFNTLKIFLSTDKPIYQPSQTIHIRTLVYEGAIPKSSQKQVQLEIQTPIGDKIFRKNFTPNKFGICSLNYTLSDQLPLGNYKITATVENKTTQKSVHVKRYVLPTFKIDMEGIKRWYTIDEDISGAVNCEYFFGKNIEGNVTIDAKVYNGVWQTIATKKGKLENGTFPFHINSVNYATGIPINNDNGYLELNITVTDEGGHKEKESHLLTISQKPIKITLLNDNNFEGANSTYYILARYPDGNPVMDGKTIFSIDNKDYETKTDDRGIASLTFLYKNQNEIKVKVTKEDLESTENFRIKTSKGIKVIANKAHYNIGEIVKCEIFYSGSSYTNLVYYEIVSEGFIVSTGRITLSNDRGDFNLPITLDMAPLSEIKVYKIQKDMSVIKDTVIVGVKSEENVSVEINTDKDLYEPNNDVNIQFSVKNSTMPLVSAMEVSIVDLSVFEISERFEGIEEIFFNMEEEFMTPRYQILNYVFSENVLSLETDSTENVIETEISEKRTILNVGSQNIQKAEDMKDKWVNSYWTVLILLGIALYFIIFLLGIKHKNTDGIVISIVLLLVIAGLSAIIINDESDDSKFITGGIDEGNEFNEAEDIAWKGGPFEQEFAERDMQGGDAIAFDDNADANKAITTSSEDNKFAGTESNNGNEKPTHVRDYFPETWYWNPTLITNEKGKASINLLTPDSITTWGVKALSSTIDAQFGVGTKNITVFQEFFVEPDIPVSVVRNDRFPLKILVYNYVNESRNINVELTKYPWFNVLSPLSQNINVDANSVSSVEFTIVAKDVGENTIKVSAKNGDLEDIVMRIVRVEPDGKKVEKLFNGQLENNQTSYATIDLDENRVPKSENAYVKLQGGMEAVTLDGAENYIHFVSGCGEQSMSTLSIDILAFDTVQKMDGTDEQLFKFENIVTQGIQHELTFLLKAKNGKGRGIVWFPEDQDVHPWLTSWGLITFQDAINAGFTIDDNIITDMQEWLVSQQDSDGSFQFPEWGIYETNNPILKTKKVATTAYITRALLYSGYSSDSDAVKDAIKYIENNIKEQWEDPYTIALALIALEDGNGEKDLRDEITIQLISLTKEENGTVYWTTENSMLSSGKSEWYGSYNSHTIENTAYAIIALNKHGGQSELVNKGVKYLLTHRKGLGGFFSTQDTVVAFQALSSIGEINIKDLNVKIYVNDQIINETNFTQDNRDLTYYIDIRPYLEINTEIKLQSQGEGSVVYQVYYEEYIPWEIIGIQKPKDIVLDVTYDATNIKVNDKLTAHCKLQFLGKERIQMILIELKAPVGFSFSSEEFEVLLYSGTIDNYEIANREIMVYVNDIEPEYSLEFDYHLVANKPIKGTVQGVNAWDMYNPDMKAETEPIEIESYEKVI